jgi:hypothetical protein
MLKLCPRGAAFAVFAAFVLGAGQPREASAVADPTRVGFPSSDPVDGRFLSMPGKGMGSLHVPTHLSIGVPSTEAGSPVTVDVFDGDQAGKWDQPGGATTTFSLYADPRRDGTGMTLLASAQHGAFADDAWTPLYDAPANAPSAQAPSGHFFYRVIVTIEGDAGVINGYKVAVRGVGQISAIQNEFSVIGGAVQIGRTSGLPAVDWVITSTDPLPTQVPPANPANTYDGTFRFKVWVGQAGGAVSWQEGDSDHATDATAAVGAEAALPPAPGGPPDGVTIRVQGGETTDYSAFVVGSAPRYRVLAPNGSVLATVNDPSGNSEYETVPTFDTTQIGYYTMEWSDLDCRNTLFVKPAYGTEVFSAESTPLGAPLATGQGGLRGVVFHDRNGNGLLDAREKGVAGVPVDVTNLDTLATTTVLTNAYGEYAAGLPAGSYVAEPAAGSSVEGVLATTVSDRSPVVTVVNGQTRTAAAEGFVDETGATPSLNLVPECRGRLTHLGLDVELPADLTGRTIQVQYLRPFSKSLYDAVTFTFNGRFSTPVVGFNRNLRVVNCWVEDGITHVVIDTTTSSRGVVRRELRAGDVAILAGPDSANTGRLEPLCRPGYLTHGIEVGDDATVKSLR